MTAKACKGAQIVRSKLAVAGQSVVASACNVDIGTVSRWISEGKLDQFCVAVEALGLKLVPSEARCVKNTEELEHLLWLARKGLESVKRAEDLVWVDDEIPLQTRETESNYNVVQIL